MILNTMSINTVVDLVKKANVLLDESARSSIDTVEVYNAVVAIVAGNQVVIVDRQGNFLKFYNYDIGTEIDLVDLVSSKIHWISGMMHGDQETIEFLRQTADPYATYDSEKLAVLLLSYVDREDTSL